MWRPVVAVSCSLCLVAGSLIFSCERAFLVRLCKWQFITFLDPFGGDPFKESDPFKGTSSEDFFKRSDKSDLFGSADSFGRKPTPPAKVSTSFSFFSSELRLFWSANQGSFKCTKTKAPLLNQFCFFNVFIADRKKLSSLKTRLHWFVVLTWSLCACVF